MVATSESGERHADPNVEVHARAGEPPRGRVVGRQAGNRSYMRRSSFISHMSTEARVPGVSAESIALKA